MKTVHGIAIFLALASASQLQAAILNPVIVYDTWPATPTTGSGASTQSVAGATVTNTGSLANQGTLQNGGNTGSVWTYPTGPDDGINTPPRTAINFNDGKGGSGTLNAINTNYTLAQVSGSDGSFTMNAWVKLNSNNDDNMVFGTNGGSPLHLGFRGSQAWWGGWGNDSNGAGGTTPALGTWTYMSWVFNGATDTQQIYENGVQIDNAGGHTAPGQQSEMLLVGGNGANAGDFDGALDEVAIYNFAATGAQETALYANAQLPDATPEPSSIVALIGMCGVGLIGLIRYRRRAASRSAD